MTMTGPTKPLIICAGTRPLPRPLARPPPFAAFIAEFMDMGGAGNSSPVVSARYLGAFALYIPHDNDQHASDRLGIVVVIVNSSGGGSADSLYELL
jgi:hypothetical protein